MTYSHSFAGLGSDQSDKRAEARALYAQAQRAYDAGDYSLAVKTFDRAYRTYSLPTVFVAIAMSYREMGEMERAQQYAQRYLYADPTGPLAEKAREIKTDAEAALRAPSTPVAPSVQSPAAPLPQPDDAYPVRATRGVFAITILGVAGLIGAGVYMKRRAVRPNRRRRRTSRRR